MSDGEILIGEIARCRSREDVEASVSDGEQCYKNLVAASCVSKTIYSTYTYTIYLPYNLIIIIAYPIFISHYSLHI